ncbi:MAG: transcriptional regulator [Clostridiales bacterium]|nr:transcriptional regulator [Clostridiales bacterium]
MKVSTDQRKAIEQKAELLKAISHPVRLCIVNGLLQTPSCTVNKIQSCLDLPQSTISQHLTRLKNAGIVAGERDGTEVKYRVINQDIIDIIHCLFADSNSKINKEAGGE